jgi:hypothetical protein
MSHPSPLPPPTHLPMTWTPSSRPVLRFARLLHHTPLLLQVLRSLSSRHTRARRPRPSHAWPQPAPRTAPTSLFAPRAASASRFTKPPLVYQQRHPTPVSEPSRVRSSVYHPIVVARDPRSTHPMVTRRAVGVTKPVDRLQLSTAAAPPTLPTVPTSVRSALAGHGFQVIRLIAIKHLNQ